MSNELIMPEQVSGFATVLPSYSVSVVRLNNGAEQRNMNWKNHLSRFVISGVYRTLDGDEELIDQYTITELLYFFHETYGPYKPFRMKVFSDYKCLFNRGFLEEGFGTGKPTYQLKKYYSDINIKAIKKPNLDNEFIIKRNGSVVDFGVSAGNISIDDTTGIVTFKPDREIIISSITLGNNPIVTTSVNHGLTNHQVVYFAGLNNNSTLNNNAYEITYLSENTFQISGITNNFAVTEGKVQLYPQPSEPLRWQGEFYYWVRFTDDFLDHTNAEGIVQLGTVNIEEVRT